MKKIVLSCSFILLAFSSSYAQMNKLVEFENTYIKPYFPVVAAIVFIVGVLMNLGKFFGENRDIKSGITSIFIYLGVLFVVAGLYVVIRNMTL